MLKKIFIILFLIVGCTGKVDTVELSQKVNIDYYYLSTCSECIAFKKEAIPYLEDRFGDSIEIHQYDLDDPQNTQGYDNVIDSLVDFDEEFYGYGPFIVVDDYFAILGYTSGDEKYLAQDIENATMGKECSDELEGLRFQFK